MQITFKVSDLIFPQRPLSLPADRKRLRCEPQYSFFILSSNREVYVLIVEFYNSLKFSGVWSRELKWRLELKNGQCPTARDWGMKPWCKLPLATSGTGKRTRIGSTGMAFGSIINHTRVKKSTRSISQFGHCKLLTLNGRSCTIGRCSGLLSWTWLWCVCMCVFSKEKCLRLNLTLF